MAGAGCASHRIVNYDDVPIKTGGEISPSSDDVRFAILNAGQLVPTRPWTMTDAGPGKIIGWLDVGKSRHLVMVDITYGAERYSVAYRSSARMDYSRDDSTINSAYNVWVTELVEQINRSLGEARPSGAISAPAAGPIAARTPYMSELPKPGDTWTYRLKYRSRRGEPAPIPSERTYVVKVGTVSATSVGDEWALDGAPAANTLHANGSYLLSQAVSIFAPYFVAFHDVSKDAPFGEVAIQDAPCKENYYCEATVSLAGLESVKVPAGTFSAIKLVIEQRWRAAGSPPNAAQMSGNRVLMAWYVPKVKRVVKYWSRSRLGTIMPFDSTFDLDLVNFQVK